MKILGIIPARFHSTRLPGKMLLEINGKTMLQRTYEQAMKSSLLDKVVIATDSDEIFRKVQEFGGKAFMSSVAHNSGTDRCAEIAIQFSDFNYVVNIQGDEPFIEPELIDQICNLLKSSNPEILTLISPIKSQEDLFEPSVVKVVKDLNQYALYFSRNPIPYNRAESQIENWLSKTNYYRHIGMYAYRTDVLIAISKLPMSKLEKSESLEQLRWLENGYKILTMESYSQSMGVDTQSDLLAANDFAKLKNL